MAFDGKTPVEATGIELNLKGNKWEEMVRKASRNNVAKRDEMRLTHFDLLALAPTWRFAQGTVWF